MYSASVRKYFLTESLRVNRVPASHRKAIKGGDRLSQEVIREAKVGE